MNVRMYVCVCMYWCGSLHSRVVAIDIGLLDSILVCVACTNNVFSKANQSGLTGCTCMHGGR